MTNLILLPFKFRRDGVHWWSLYQCLSLACTARHQLFTVSGVSHIWLGQTLTPITDLHCNAYANVCEAPLRPVYSSGVQDSPLAH